MPVQRQHKKLNKTLLAHIALFVANLIYAGNYTIAKVVMPDYIQPFAFILMRATTGFILFQLVHHLFIKEKVERQDIGRLFLCGLFGIAINQMAFFKGLNWTTPINASLIMTVTPIIVLMVSAIMLGERITMRKILGIGIGAAGAIFLILYGKSAVNTPGSRQLLGDFFILVNATSYGIYLVLVKSLMNKYHPMTIMKWVFSFGLCFVLPFSVGEFSQIDWATFSPAIWMAVAYVLLFVTFFAYFFNVSALKALDASVASSYIYLQPFLATLIALLAGKDSLSSVKIFAGVLIFIGVYLVSSQSAIRRKDF